METTFLDIYESRTGRSKFGVNISFAFPKPDFIDFIIYVDTPFAEYERFGDDSLIVTQNEEVFYNSFSDDFCDAGFELVYDEEPEMLCPTLQSRKKSNPNYYKELDIYFTPTEISGVAKESDMKKLYEILEASHFVSNIKIKIKQTIHIISSKKLQKILDSKQEQIKKWAISYVANQKYQYGSGKAFCDVYNIPIIKNSDNDSTLTVESYVENIAKKIVDERWNNKHKKPHPSYSSKANATESKFVFRCEMCGKTYSKKKETHFVKNYQEYSCKCGGNLIKIKW